ncbi:MAG: ATP-binding protein [Pseudonocardiaceae bacterium]
MVTLPSDTSPFPRAAQEDRIDYELLDLLTEATPQSARWLRVRFTEWLRTTGASATLVDDLTIAVYEALANVVEHAYPSDHPDPVMRLRAQSDYHQVLITISDNGCWRTPSAPGFRGRGLLIMRYLATEVQLKTTEHGTTVHLRVDLPWSEDDASLKNRRPHHDDIHRCWPQ